MRIQYKTDIEGIMREALIKENIDFAFQFPIRCKYGYVLDFAISDLKIDIECDGECWHKKGNSHDRKRNAFMKNQGWIILRFYGEEIKSNIHSCLTTIKDTIERRKKENENKS